MITAKQEVRKFLDNLPGDCTFDDIQYHIYALQKINKGLNDAEKGNVYTQEEMEERLAKWI